MRSRVLVVGILLAIAMTGVDSGKDHAEAAGKKPDIIVIMLDDHAYLQNEKVLKRQPNFRKHFLRGGMRLQHIYGETPTCCPARVNIFSGQSALKNGVVRNDGDLWVNPHKSIQVALDEAGYHTFLVGKYLNQYDGDKTPPGWDNISWNKAWSPVYWRNGKKKSYKPLHVNQATGKQAIKWTKNAPYKRPIFAIVSPFAPHADYCKAKPYWCYQPRVPGRDIGASRCDGVGRFKPPTYSLSRKQGPNQPMPRWPKGWKLAKICESLIEPDRTLARIVQIQKKRNRPAYFILMSDNGMSWGWNGNPWKVVPQSTRLPFYVKGPGVSKGSRSNALLSIIDVAPTIADMAGINLPWADGVSFLPILKGRSNQGRDEVLELLREYPQGTAGYGWGWEAIRRYNWHYIRWWNGTRQLFRYREDRWEQRNLVNDHRSVADDLDKRLDQLIQRMKN